MDHYGMSERELELLTEYQQICDYIYQIRKKSMETYRKEHEGESAFVYGCLCSAETEDRVLEDENDPVISSVEETGMIWPPYLAVMAEESVDDKLEIIFSLGLSTDQAKRFFSEPDGFMQSVTKRDLILRYFIEREIFDRERMNDMLLLFKEQLIE